VDTACQSIRIRFQNYMIRQSQSIAISKVIINIKYVQSGNVKSNFNVEPQRYQKQAKYTKSESKKGLIIPFFIAIKEMKTQIAPSFHIKASSTADPLHIDQAIISRKET